MRILFICVIGIDLYFGRWDTHAHCLTDTGQVAFKPNGEQLYIDVS